MGSSLDRSGLGSRSPITKQKVVIAASDSSSVIFMSDPNLGQKLANRYELMELVGQGAMGKVYRAEDTLLGGVIVAVKFLSQTDRKSVV